MNRGYWDRDGFHEGRMPAIDFGSAHACIVNPDGSVSGIDRSPSPHWRNSLDGARGPDWQHASPGAAGDRQQEGADIDLQPAQGSSVAGGFASPSPSLGNRQSIPEVGNAD